MPTLIAYDRARSLVLVRDWSVQQLLSEVHAGRFGAGLSAGDAEELASLANAWVQRALGPMPLRDALMVDAQRGPLVYDLICAALVVETCTLSAAAVPLFAPLAARALTPKEVRSLLQEQETDEQTGALSGLLEPMLQRAEAEGLALLYAADAPLHYPSPDFDTLLPAPPPPARTPIQRFEHPTGRRRAAAMALALLGVALLGTPLLFGHLPTQPAGLPLALLTLALLVGVRAGWAGFAGSLCIWVVANLPGFHHDRMVALWPDVPLLVVGVALLALDRRVRVMWRWIRRLGRE